MIGIILMIVGCLGFVVGIFLFSKTEKRSVIATHQELNKIIEMATVDGVLTPNEREIIRNIAEEKGLNAEDVLIQIENQIEAVDSETQLIDYNKKNGDDFEKFVAQKFDKKYFTIKEWAGDKYINGVYAETTPQPDLLVELKFKNVCEQFSVECKWRQNLYKNGVLFATQEQYKRYKSYQQEKNIRVFIAIGVGGSGCTPKELFIVPLSNINGNFITINTLRQYQKMIDKNFFFDIEKKYLK